MWWWPPRVAWLGPYGSRPAVQTPPSFGRCGGEIVSSPASRIAHMWRRSDAKQTLARYVVPPGASVRNRARAAKAHFGAYFGAKTLTFPAFKEFAREGGKSLDTARFGPPAGFGRCHSFEWYIRRFARIYRDAGVLPRTVFQIEAVPRGELRRGGTSGLCLRMVGHAKWGNGLAASDELELAPCADCIAGRADEDLNASTPCTVCANGSFASPASYTVP